MIAANSTESEDTLEQFRKDLRRRLIEKGIFPPAKGSAREKELYRRWQQGKEKLKKMADES